MGKGGGGGSQTQTQTTTLPSYIQGPLKRLLARAEGVADTDYLSYDPSARVAGLSQDELSAFDLIRQNAGAYTPFVDEALGGTQSVLSQLGQAPSSSTMQSYMNPYLQQVLDRQRYEAERSYDISSKKLGDQAQAASAFGGSRFAVANNELQDDYLDNLANIQAEGMNNAWTQAQNQYNMDIQNRLSGNMQLANLAGLGQQQVSNTAGLLQGAGQQQRAIDQALLDADYDEFQRYQNFPYEQTSWLSGIIQPSVNAMQGNTTTTKTKEAEGSMFGKILGTGLSIAAMGIPGGGTIGGSLFGSMLGSSTGLSSGAMAMGSSGPFFNFAEGGAIPAMQPVNRSSLPAGSWWDRIASRVSSTGTPVRQTPVSSGNTSGVRVPEGWNFAKQGFGGMSGYASPFEAAMLRKLQSGRTMQQVMGPGMVSGRAPTRQALDSRSAFRLLAAQYGFNKGGPVHLRTRGNDYESLLASLSGVDEADLLTHVANSGDMGFLPKLGLYKPDDNSGSSNNIFLKALGMLDAVSPEEISAPLPGRKPNMIPERDRYETPFPAMPSYNHPEDPMAYGLPSFMEYDDSDIPSEIPMDMDEAKYASGGSVRPTSEEVIKEMIALGMSPVDIANYKVTEGRGLPPNAPKNVLSVGPLTLTDRARKEYTEGSRNPWLSINKGDAPEFYNKLQRALDPKPYVPEVSDSRLERLAKGAASGTQNIGRAIARLPFDVASGTKNIAEDVGSWLTESPDLAKGKAAKEAFKSDMDTLNAARKSFVDTAPKPELAKLTTPKGKTSQGVPVETKKPTKAEQAIQKHMQQPQQEQKSVVEEMFGSTNVPMLMAGIALMTSKGDPFSALGEGLGAYIQGKESVGQMKLEAKKAEREAMLEDMKMSFEQQRIALMERELGIRASEAGREKAMPIGAAADVHQKYMDMLVKQNEAVTSKGGQGKSMSQMYMEAAEMAVMSDPRLIQVFQPAIMKQEERYKNLEKTLTK